MFLRESQFRRDSGRFMKNEKAVVNDPDVKLHDDGAFTAFVGSVYACGDEPYRVDITDRGTSRWAAGAAEMRSQTSFRT